MTDAAPDIVYAAPADTQRPPSKPFSPPLPGLWVFLACLLIALLCNAGGLRGKGFVGAEQTLVRDNDLLNRLPGLQLIWFRANDPATYPLPQYAPLAQTMFFFEHMAFGDRIAFYRLTSVILHAGVGLMIWLLLRRLSVAGAVAAALLFVAHPMSVNNISWIAERRNPLAALLALSATYLLLRAANIILPGTGKTKLLPDDPLRLYAIGATLFVLALFSNPIVATLPLVVLLIAWWKRLDPALKPDVRLTSVCIGLLIAGIGMLALSSSIEKARAGAASPAAWNRASTTAGELAVRTQIAGRAVAFYVQKLVVPFPVSIDYPRWQTPRDVEQFKTFSTDKARADAKKADVSPGDPIAWLVPVGVIVALAASWVLRSRLGRGQFVAVAGFLLLLAPSLGFIDLGWMRYTFVADRAVYLASVPFIAGFVWIGAVLLAKADDRTVTISSASVVVALFAVLSFNYSRSFRDAPYFWISNARAFTTSRTWWPRYEIAASLVNDPDPSGFRLAKQAIGDVRLSRPDEPSGLVMAGLLKLRDGDEVGAIADFESCMQTFPTYAPAYYETAESFRAQADLHPTDPKPRLTAMRLYAETAARDPLDALARVRLGETSWEVARRMDVKEPSLPEYLDQAATAFDEAVQLKPYNVDLLVAVSRTLIEMGKLSDAGALLESAHTIAPFRADVYVVIADAALARKPADMVGADGALRAAISLEPTMVGARLRLGRIRQAQERWREAREEYNAVLAVLPDHAEAKKRLAEIDTAATTRPGV